MTPAIGSGPSPLQGLRPASPPSSGAPAATTGAIPVSTLAGKLGIGQDELDRMIDQLRTTARLGAADHAAGIDSMLGGALVDVRA